MISKRILARKKIIISTLIRRVQIMSKTIFSCFFRHKKKKLKPQSSILVSSWPVAAVRPSQVANNDRAQSIEYKAMPSVNGK
jgi:hypothetical protein